MIISAPLYLSFDLRDEAKMDRVWPIVTNEEAISINQQYAGHPGRLVRAWTPTPTPTPTPTNQTQTSHTLNTPLSFVVTADLHSCQTGWSYDTATKHIMRNGAGDVGSSSSCITVPPPANGNTNGSAALGSTYYDDAALVVQACDRSNPAQRFDQHGNYFSTPVANGNGTVEPFYIHAEPWYEGAGVRLSATASRQLFFVNGRLQSGPYITQLPVG